MCESPGYERLEKRLGYQFKDPSLLESALTHASFLNENPGLGRSDNQRLEFLGDAVVDLVVGHLLMERFPQLAEGDLSMLRAQIVSEPGLFEVAQSLALGDWLFLGRGEEQTGGRRKPSLLSDTCEAVIAAIYLDGGFQAAFDVSARLFAPWLARFEEAGSSDHKTKLQERAQGLYHATPRYAVVGETGPGHDKTFVVAVMVGDREYARASGRSKKEAEQRAARTALTQLEEEQKAEGVTRSPTPTQRS